MVLSGLAFEPATRAAGAPAALIGRAVATPMVTHDTVVIQNLTGFHIEVIARLQVPGLNKPTITRRIAPNGVDTISFNRHTKEYIQIEVKRVGGNTPPPFTVTLNQPLDGYNGARFMISVFGGRFNVSP
jgi:hypothetical protein